MVRRHTRTTDDEHHYRPAVGVCSGNFVTGRRRGTVDGIDFGNTGSGESPISDIVTADLSPCCLISALVFKVQLGMFPPTRDHSLQLPTLDTLAQLYGSTCLSHPAFFWLDYILAIFSHNSATQ